MTTTSEPTEPIPADARRVVGPASRVRRLGTSHPILLVWFATLVFSTGPVMIAAASVSGPVFSFWRLWIGTVLVGTLAVANHRRQRPTGGSAIDAVGIRWTLIAGAAFALHQIMFIVALRQTSVVDVTLMNTLSPVVVAVLAVPLFGERPGLSFRLWSLVAIGGAVVVAVAGSQGPQGQPVGVALAAGNVVFYSLFFVCSKQARPHIDTMTFLAGTVACAAVFVSGLVLVIGADLGSITAHDLLLCLAVAALPGIFGHFSMTWSLKWVPANLPPVIMLAIPLLSGLLAWLLLGQGVSPMKLVGGAITVVGVAGSIRSPAAKALAAETMATETMTTGRVSAEALAAESLDFAEEA